MRTALLPAFVGLALVGCDVPDEVAANIDSNTAKIAALEVQLAELATANETLAADLAAETAAREASDAEIAALKVQLEGITGDLDGFALMGDFNALVGRVDGHDADLAGHGDRLTALEATDVTLGEAVGVNEVAIAANAASISDNATDIAANASTLASHATDLAANAAAIGTNATAIAANASKAGDNASDIAALDDSVSELQTDLDTVETDLTDLSDAWDDSVIVTDTTWTVGGSGADYSTVEAAVDAAHDVRIAADATLTIKVNNGTYNLTETLNFKHPNGSQIHLIGNETSPASVVLNSPGRTAINVGTNYALGRVSGFKLIGDGKGGQGVEASWGGFVRVGKIEAEQFSHGVYGAWGGVVHGDTNGGVTVRNSTSHGIYFAWNATGHVQGALTEKNAAHGFHSHVSDVSLTQITSQDNKGEGVSVFWGGYVDAYQGKALRNSGSGFNAHRGGVMHAPDGEARFNGGHGYIAHWVSHLEAGRVKSYSNGGYGLYSAYLSMLHSPSRASGSNGGGHTYGTYYQYGPN